MWTRFRPLRWLHDHLNCICWSLSHGVTLHLLVSLSCKPYSSGGVEFSQALMFMSTDFRLYVLACCCSCCLLMPRCPSYVSLAVMHAHAGKPKLAFMCHAL